MRRIAERGIIRRLNRSRSLPTRGRDTRFRRSRPSGRGRAAATVPVLALLALLTSAPCPAADPEIETRLGYLETRLDDSRDAVRLWQDGWTAVYGGAAIAYAGMALDADDSDDRTLHALGALRATVAATLLSVRPHPGRDGADEIRALTDAPATDRLAAAEALLEASARRTRSKRRPARHLRNLVINAGFGGLVWLLGDRDDALPFTLLGIAGGEAVLLSLPEGPRRDLEGYRAKFRSRSAGAGSWRLVARPGGLAVEIPLPR